MIYDVTIKNSLLFYHIKQFFVVGFYGSRPQRMTNVVRMWMPHLAVPHVPLMAAMGN